MQKILIALAFGISLTISLNGMESQNRNKFLSINLKIKKIRLEQEIASIKRAAKQSHSLESYRKARQKAEASTKKQCKDIKIRLIKFYENRKEELAWLNENPSQVTVWDDITPINPAISLILCKWREELRSSF
ncbi:MAG: hypothetical protein AMXMBFR12_03730 [Candidatus Babeliales bacterium]